MTVIPVCGALTIFQIFFNYQDTESESREIESGVAGPILTRGGGNQCLYGTTTSILYNMGVKNVVIIHIYGDRAIPYFL